jgi:hypothetical protein
LAVVSGNSCPAACRWSPAACCGGWRSRRSYAADHECADPATRSGGEIWTTKRPA